MNKPSTFAKRLRELLDLLGWTQSKLAVKTGINKSSITHYLKGDWEGKQDAVYAIARVTNVNEAWLMGYDVPMHRTNDPDKFALNKLKEALSTFVAEDPTLPSDERLRFFFEELGYDSEIIAFNLGIDRTYIDNWLQDGDLPPQPIIDKILGLFYMRPDELLNEEELAAYHAEDKEWGKIPANILPLPANKAYPLLGDIACGTPILAEQNIAEYIQFPGDINADFCLRCKGDSMIEARIHDGDIVFIRQQPEVANGEIAAVQIGEEAATLKRVYRAGDTLTLMAANSTYPPMVYTSEQLADIRILGKAVNFLSTVK